MALPIALQLYTVRDLIAKDYKATVKAVAEAGYAGVETAGFPGITIPEAVKLFKDLGLKVASAHAGMPVGPDKDKPLDEMEALGCKMLVSGKGPDDFATPDKIKATCEVFNEAAANAKRRGIAFGVHNHWWEFTKKDGKIPYDIAVELLSPDVFFEIDTYWAKTGGEDPAEMIRKYGARVKLLHVKDGPCKRDVPMTAVGDGILDWPGIVAASKHAQWLIVEMDSCATDMMEAVRKSAHYLKSKGLGVGR